MENKNEKGSEMFPGPLRGDQLWEVVPATGGVGQVVWEVAPWFGEVVPATGGVGQVAGKWPRGLGKWSQPQVAWAKWCPATGGVGQVMPSHR